MLSDLVWLWLWRKPAAASIQPLAQELPCVTGAALKKKKKSVTDFTYFVTSEIEWEIMGQRETCVPFSSLTIIILLIINHKKGRIAQE